MSNSTDIFEPILDDTIWNTQLNENVFYFVFFEMCIRNTTNIKKIYRDVYASNWYISGLEEVINHNYHNKDSLLIKVGRCEIEMIGPFRNPKITIVKSNTVKLTLNNTNLIQINDGTDFIMF